VSGTTRRKEEKALSSSRASAGKKGEKACCFNRENVGCSIGKGKRGCLALYLGKKEKEKPPSKFEGGDLPTSRLPTRSASFKRGRGGVLWAPYSAEKRERKVPARSTNGGRAEPSSIFFVRREGKRGEKATNSYFSLERKGGECERRSAFA